MHTDFNQLLNQIDRKLQSEVEKEPRELYDPIFYFYSIGGKRFRPLLFLLGSSTLKPVDENTLEAALLVEKFHNFTLLHDDIMDNAPLRRGKATVHEKWNTNIALLAGDVMMVHAYDCLLKFPEGVLKSVLQRFNQTAVEVCEGQQWDMNFEKLQLSALSKKQYLEMIRLKTAVLLGFSIWAGATYAGATSEDAERLCQSAIALGIAFQIKDDWLDVYGDQSKVGKKQGGDILANKKTLLTILAYTQATAEDKAELNKIYTTPVLQGAQKIEKVVSIYEKYTVTSQINAFVKQYESTCMQYVDETALDTKVKSKLKAFYQMVLQRDM